MSMTTEGCMKTLRNNLYDVMAEKDCSMVVLANCSDISCDTMWGILSMVRKDIRLSTLINISNALGKPVSYLIGEEMGDAAEES